MRTRSLKRLSILVAVIIIFCMFTPGCSAKKIVVKENITRNVRPNVLEDFESNGNSWFTKTTRGSAAKLNFESVQQSGPSPKAGNVAVDFTLNRFDKINRYSVDINLKKSLNLSKFKGIKFFARSGDFKKIEIQIIEKNLLGGEKLVFEHWCYQIEVTADWKEFDIPFEKFEVENFWDQEYMSNAVQEFDDIAGIVFQINSDFQKESKSGQFWLDEIEVY